MGLIQADAFQGFHQHAFEVGNLDDLARLRPAEVSYHAPRQGRKAARPSD